MCKFCENSDEIKDDYDVSWWLSVGGVLWCEIDTFEGMETNCMKIHFCPICGAKLKEPDK